MKKAKVSVVIPNYQGERFLRACLDSLKQQTLKDMEIIIVDNASTDGSVALIRAEYPEIELITRSENTGFCGAVNTGIRHANAEYVILLNNDTTADPHFAEELYRAVSADPQIFSAQAMMLQMDAPELIDDAGDTYNALGWARARGKGKRVDQFHASEDIFACCGGAAIYRKSVFEKIGYFDEAHFAYLEDIDIGYRAKICGYRNRLVPKAVIYHKGSAATGSRYNAFKVSHAARNNIYLIYKNMSRWQILINLPFLAAGHLIKFLFFLCKGFGLTYLKGLWQGILLARKGQKAAFLPENFDNCWKIQLQLWKNIG
ncbi:MAG: glycosyltransferase family 2 protein [Eubacteriales bacterium]|nr:glycosyltransferase family 2 protein [Eubacteriales bacterium]